MGTDEINSAVDKLVAAHDASYVGARAADVAAVQMFLAAIMELYDELTEADFTQVMTRTTMRLANRLEGVTT